MNAPPLDDLPQDERDRLVRLARAARLKRQAAIPTLQRGMPFPLSFAQRRLWFVSRMQAESAPYHISIGLRIGGRLDRSALQHAFSALVARHESLRTTFALVGDEPVQIIASGSTDNALHEEDLTDCAARNVLDAAVHEAVAAEARMAFDLEKGPLVRGRLLKLGEAEHVLLITMHHIVSDGWSLGVATDELTALYRARLDSNAEPLPALAVQYADYAVWQRGRLQEASWQAQMKFWRQTLTGAPAVLDLPFDSPRPAQQDFAGGYVELALDPALTSNLKALSQRHGTTLFMTVLTGWAALLSRLSGQEDLVVGAPTANRRRKELAGMIGFFVNVLALRIDLSGDPDVAELLARVKAHALAAHENQELPFEQVVEIVNPPRSTAHSPLFQVSFTWQNNDEGTLHVPGLKFSRLEGHSGTAKHDLSLYLGEVGDRISGGLEYATALFERSTIERYCGYLRQVLQAMVEDDSRSIATLPLLDASERRRLLVEWNATHAAYPDHSCIHELIE
ncbi:condensation domain-containing protein, partial [Herbaspirillum sp. GCM10030257]|uniref:condensation domain-containing protein n=1 Tax=Herbaspirillum sp. GCM10030257 TaxID=3273393 RepID=UPI00360B3BCC